MLLEQAFRLWSNVRILLGAAGGPVCLVSRARCAVMNMVTVGRCECSYVPCSDASSVLLRMHAAGITWAGNAPNAGSVSMRLLRVAQTCAHQHQRGPLCMQSCNCFRCTAHNFECDMFTCFAVHEQPDLTVL